jgi:hypothetical protein
MAHYAFIDDNSIVTQVIPGRNEDEVVEGISDWEAYYAEVYGQTCFRTSYNGNIRYNYAGVGYTYDADRDAFIEPKPYESWVLDEVTCQWQAPTPYPDDGKDYHWNEESLTWEAIPGSE